MLRQRPAERAARKRRRVPLASGAVRRSFRRIFVSPHRRPGRWPLCPGRGGRSRPRLGPHDGLRLRQWRHGPRRAGALARGGTAGKPIPVRGVLAFSPPKPWPGALPRAAPLGTRRRKVHAGRHPAGAPTFDGRGARNRRADDARHHDRRRHRPGRPASAPHGRVAQLASHLHQIRRRLAVPRRSTHRPAPHAGRRRHLRRRHRSGLGRLRRRLRRHLRDRGRRRPATLRPSGPRRLPARAPGLAGRPDRASVI
ncbi:hypothetical protein D3C71_1459950 [compost metagenome]